MWTLYQILFHIFIPEFKKKKTKTIFLKVLLGSQQIWVGGTEIS